MDICCHRHRHGREEDQVGLVATARTGRLDHSSSFRILFNIDTMAGAATLLNAPRRTRFAVIKPRKR